MKKDIIIIILIVLVLGLGGYLVFDKVLSNNETEIKEEQQAPGNNEQNESSNEITIEKKDAAYFDEYLKAFTSSCDGRIGVTKNTENFTNKDISNFISGYYNRLSYGTGYRNVYVSDVEALIYKYFNRTDVVLETNPSAATTIIKQDSTYKIEWTPMGCESDRAVDPVVTYNGENVTVKYQLYADMCELEEDCGYTGKSITFHLKYNNGNYNLIKIEA